VKKIIQNLETGIKKEKSLCQLGRGGRTDVDLYTRWVDVLEFGGDESHIMAGAYSRHDLMGMHADMDVAIWVILSPFANDHLRSIAVAVTVGADTPGEHRTSIMAHQLDGFTNGCLLTASTESVCDAADSWMLS
jgi:hypothetical protein